MLSLFNKYLMRMRNEHPVLGNRNLLILILEYLEGEDLFSCQCVCFLWKSTILSVPTLEVRMLRFTMTQSNEVIVELQKRSPTEGQRVKVEDIYDFSFERFSLYPKILPKPKTKPKIISKEKIEQVDAKMDQ